MRVIAGTAGGIRLDVPKTDLRPTMDRVKGAIFSSLSDKMVGAQVLDLFAGTGALGIEALSRGAAAALFVENDRAAALAIECNFVRTKVRGSVTQQDVFRFLKGARRNQRFDLIFADPPYDRTPSGQSYTDLLLGSIELRELLSPEGIFILEKRPEEQLPSAPSWEVTRARTYGATEVLFLRTYSPAPEIAHEVK